MTDTPEDQPIDYPAEVRKAIAEVCPSDDPLDDCDFDPVDYINARFPDERSLDNLADFIQSVEAKVGDTEAELMEMVQLQATTSRCASMDLRSSREAVDGLFTRVSDIKKKAVESEEMVQSICKDIRALDTAKKNLTESIRSLKNLQLVMLSMDSMAECFDRKDFRQTAEHLRTAKALMQHFEPFAEVPKVKELSEKFRAQCRQIEFFVRNSVVTEINTGEEIPQDVVDAASVIDALGSDEIKKTRRTFVEKEVAKYVFMFRRGTEEYKLEKTERRFAWIRRWLDMYEDSLSHVFPETWCVPQEMCVEYCLATRKDIATQLADEGGCIDVGVLLRVLQKTLELEQQLTVSMRVLNSGNGTEGGGVNYQYYGMIASCFEDHMGHYVEHEKRAMEDSLMEEVEADDWDELVGQNVQIGRTLNSATELFMFIKESLRRVLTLSHGSTFAQMISVWRQFLVEYAGMISRKIPTPPTTPEQVRKVCVAIATAEYCQHTAMGLQEEAQSKIEETLKSSADFDDVTEAFTQLLSLGISQLIAGYDRSISSAVGELMTTNWAAYVSQDTIDESHYVAEIRRVSHQYLYNVAQILPLNRLRYFCDKLAASVIPRYGASIIKLRRPLTDQAISQLRIDCGALEKIFLTLPNAESSPQQPRFSVSSLANYSKFVKREFNKCNNFLKVIQCEVSPRLVEHYLSLVAESDQSLTDFGRLLDLKGVKKDDSRAYVTLLQRKGVRETVARDNQVDLTGADNNGMQAADGDGEIIGAFRNKMKDKFTFSSRTLPSFGMKKS